MRKMRIRDWTLRRWLVTAAVVVLLVLIGVRVQMKLRLRRAITELRLAGKPTRYEDLNRLQGRVDGAPNLVTALTNAIVRLPELDRETRKLLPIVGEARTPPAGTPWPADMETAVRNHLENNAGILEEVRAALSITNAWWSVDFDPRGWGLNGMARAKAASAQLSLSADYRAQAGDIDGALDDVYRIFLIAERMYSDPTLIGQLVRTAVRAVGIHQAGYVLDCGEPSQEAVARLRAILRAELGHVSLSHVYEGDRVYLLEPAYYHSDRMLINEELAFTPYESSFEDYKDRVLVLGYRLSGLANRDILYGIETYGEIAERAGTVAGWVDLEAHWPQLLPSSRGLRFCVWSEQAFSIGAMALRKFIDNMESLRAMDAALAVAEYRLKHDGEMPASLEALVPEFLDAVPVEPRSGKPFELIVTGDGFGVGRGTPVFKVKLKQL